MSIEERIYSEAFEDGVSYAIQRMFAFTKKNITAFNRKLELAKAGKLHEVNGKGVTNGTNKFINGMASSIKDGDAGSFNTYKKLFDRYQTTNQGEIAKALRTEFQAHGDRTTSDSYDMLLAYKRQQLKDPDLRKARLKEGRENMKKIREREKEAKTAEDLQNFHF